MRVSKKNGCCPSCNGELDIIEVSDATMIVELWGHICRGN